MSSKQAQTARLATVPGKRQRAQKLHARTIRPVGGCDLILVPGLLLLGAFNVRAVGTRGESLEDPVAGGQVAHGPASTQPK